MLIMEIVQKFVFPRRSLLNAFVVNKKDYLTIRKTVLKVFVCIKTERFCRAHFTENHFNGPKLIFTTFDNRITSQIYYSNDFKNKGSDLQYQKIFIRSLSPNFLELFNKYSYWDFQAMSYDYERSSLYLIDRDYKLVII